MALRWHHQVEYSFSVASANIWNTLPDDVTSAPPRTIACRWLWGEKPEPRDIAWRLIWVSSGSTCQPYELAATTGSVELSHSVLYTSEQPACRRSVREFGASGVPGTHPWYAPIRSCLLVLSACFLAFWWIKIISSNHLRVSIFHSFHALSTLKPVLLL